VREITEGFPFEVIGKVSGGILTIKVSGKEKISANVSELEAIWNTSLGKELEGDIHL
jgi:hypothetical protein